MSKRNVNRVRLERRRRGIRKGLFGTSDRPRLTVYRSHKNIYAQIVDDEKGATVCQASSQDKELRQGVPNGGNRAAAVEVGKVLATRAKEKGVTKIRFDRNGRKFHGRIKSLADAVREGGLEF